MQTPDNKVKYLKQFKGGSMAKTFLIEKENQQYVRKEVEDKSGLGLSKLEKQADWIIDLEQEVAQSFPDVVEKNFGDSFGYYHMTYHEMPSFRDYLIEAGEVNDDIRRILKEIISYGAKIAREEISNTDLSSYVKKSHIDKMLQRCEMVTQKDDIFNSFFDAPFLVINGKKYSNFKEITSTILNNKDLMNLLSPKQMYRSHGDFTFQNVLTDGQEFKIIDPRGEGEDHLYYDISKLFQSSSSKYDLFTEGNYVVDYSLNDNSINYKILENESLFNDTLNVIKEEIPKAFPVEKEWELIALFYEASHLVAMAPFRYEENLPFTLACYAIGVAQLNKIVEMWNGDNKNGN